MSFFARYLIGVALVGTAVATFWGIALPAGKWFSQGGLCRIASIGPKCYERRILLTLTDRGTLEAQEFLKSLFERGYITLGTCHRLGHVLGQEAFRQIKSIEQALATARPYCNDAYYHGLMQAFFGDEEIHDFLSSGSTERARSACSRYKDRDDLDALACLHGVGHGLLYATRGDLLSALRLCDVYDYGRQRDQCYDGAFMENVFSLFPHFGSPGKFARVDDPLFPCRAVDQHYRQICYWRSVPLQVFHPGGVKTVRGAKEIVALSHSIPQEFRKSFWHGVGREVHSLMNGDEEKISRYCKSLPAEESGTCLRGAAAHLLRDIREL